MSNLIFGVLIGLFGSIFFFGLMFAAFVFGTRQNRFAQKVSSSIPTSPKRRIPTSGTTVLPGGIAQTQFPISGFSTNVSDTDTA